MQYDLVIEGAHVIDPARGIDRVMSVAVANGQIAAVGSDADPREAKRVIRAEGKYLSPGWFDMHLHIYSTLAFSDPDTVGVLQGVPTVVDAGGTGAWTYEDCRRYWEGYCKTDVYSFLIDRSVGIFTAGRGDLDIGKMQKALAVPIESWKEVVERNRDRILAIKTTAESYQGAVRPQKARAIAEAVGLPCYMHIGDIHPSNGPHVTREALNLMRPGDMVTHVYSGNYGNILDTEGVVLPEATAAFRRGVHSDVGFGHYNFSFDALDKLMAQGVVTDVISSDLQSVNITGPTFSLANVMSIFLNHGLGLKEVIERVTINPARIQGLDHKIGSLTPGYPARITVFGLHDGDWTFQDAKGGRRQGQTMIVPSFCVVGGEVIETDMEAGQAQKNWAFLPSLEELPACAENLDDEQREFARALAQDYEKADWNNGWDLQGRFKSRVAASGIDERKATNAVYDLLMESRFCVPVGWLLYDMNEKDATVARLRGA